MSHPEERKDSVLLGIFIFRGMFTFCALICTTSRRQIIMLKELMPPCAVEDEGVVIIWR